MDLRTALRDLKEKQQRLRVWQHLVAELSRFLDGDVGEPEQMVTDSGDTVSDDAVQDVLSLVETHAKQVEADMNAFLTSEVRTNGEDPKESSSGESAGQSKAKSRSPRARTKARPARSES